MPAACCDHGKVAVGHRRARMGSQRGELRPVPLRQVHQECAACAPADFQVNE